MPLTGRQAALPMHRAPMRRAAPVTRGDLARRAAVGRYSSAQDSASLRILWMQMPSRCRRAGAQRLKIIQEQIIAAGGSIPFWKFMELALYAPGLGYYSAGATKFGDAGDFVTAPEISPLYRLRGRCADPGAATARARRAVRGDRRRQRRGCAETALAKLLANDALPARYAILEPSADLRERQRERLGTVCRHCCSSWSNGWTGRSRRRGTACCSPTVIDDCRRRASPFATKKSSEEHVALDGERPLPAQRPAGRSDAGRRRTPCGAAVAGTLRRGYRSELLAQLPYWLQAVVGGGMGDGAMLFVDYGYARASTTSRNAATAPAARVPPAPPGIGRVRRSGAAGHHRIGRFHRAGGRPAPARANFTGYCSQASFLLGNRAENLERGRIAGEGRRRAAITCASKPLLTPAQRDGRTLPGDGLPARGGIRRPFGRRPEPSPNERRTASRRALAQPFRRLLWSGLWMLAVAVVVVACWCHCVRFA